MDIKRSDVVAEYNRTAEKLTALLEKYNIDEDEIYSVLKMDLPLKTKEEILETHFTNVTLFQLLRYKVVD